MFLENIKHHLYHIYTHVIYMSMHKSIDKFHQICINILSSDEVVKSMNLGSVIMDLAAENGGNCSLTQPDKIVNTNGVIIDGTINLAWTMSVHASQLYAKNVSAFILHGYDKDKKEFNLEDESVSGSMFINNGKIVDERTKNIIEGSNE